MKDVKSNPPMHTTNRLEELDGKLFLFQTFDFSVWHRLVGRFFRGRVRFVRGKFSKVVAKAKKLGAIKEKDSLKNALYSNAKWKGCPPAICVVSQRDVSLHNIQRNIWKIQDGGC